MNLLNDEVCSVQDVLFAESSTFRRHRGRFDAAEEVFVGDDVVLVLSVGQKLDRKFRQENLDTKLLSW